MLPKLSLREKLELYYIELDGLEKRLEQELARERGLAKRCLKPSRSTKYKIAVVNRTIRSYETILNGRAVLWENWDYTRHEIENLIAENAAEAAALVEQLAATEASIALAIASKPNEAKLLGFEYVKINNALLLNKKEAKELNRQQLRHLDKRPAQVSRVSKESVIAGLANNAPMTVPKALEPLAEEFIFKISEAENPVNGDSKIEYQVKPATQDTDVSFLFAGFKSTDTKEENEAQDSEEDFIPQSPNSGS